MVRLYAFPQPRAGRLGILYTKPAHYNGTVLFQEYDPLSHRFVRSRLLRTADSTELQDLRYFYDAAGNLTLKRDDAVSPVYFNNGVAEAKNAYAYDALYRLVEATGREHAVSGGAASAWNDPLRTARVHATDGQAMQSYTQRYTYDEVGNMTQMRHVAGTGAYQNNWTRSFAIDAASNRLTGSGVGSAAESYDYDGRGNLIAGFAQLYADPALNGVEQQMHYNAANQLEKVRLAAPRRAHYQYDGSGTRLRKHIADTDTGARERRTYWHFFEDYQRWAGTSLQTDRITVRTAGVQVDRRVDISQAATIRYGFSDQVGSVGLELDESGQVISVEEYYPYGSTSYQGGRTAAEVSLKRYRYTGKERDEETGLNYHGARYYAPWLGRWCAVDPKESEYAPWSSYNYAFDNPVKWNDLSGEGPGDDDKHRTGSAVGGAAAALLRPALPTSIAPQPTPARDGPLASENIPSRQAARVQPQLAEAAAQRAEQDRIDNEEVLSADIYGRGHIGPRKSIERKIEIIRREHYNHVADNIRGGIFGAIGYLAAGEVGAELGAGVDMGVGAAGALKAPTIPVRNYPLTPKTPAYTEGLKIPSGAPRGGYTTLSASPSAANRAILNPKEIHFMQSSIKNVTGEYTVLGNARDLQSGRLEPEVLRIRVWKDDGGKIWTLDHRRLAAFRLSGLREVPVQWASPKDEMWKMSTRTGGQSIRLKLENKTNIILK